MHSILRNLSARTRIVLLVVFSALPIMVLAIHNGLDQRARAQAAEEEQLQLIASLVARRPEQIIEGVRQLLFAMTADADFLLGNRARCEEHFRRVMAQVHGLYRTMGLVLPGGDIFCNAAGDTGKVNVADRDYFRMATQSGRFAVGGYQIGRVHGLPALNFAQPVMDAHKNVIAVAYASLNLGVFEEQAELHAGSRLGVSRVINFFDHSGIVIGQFPLLHARIGEMGRNPEVLRQVMAQKRGLFTAPDAAGKMRVYAFDSAGVNPDGKPAIHVVVSTPTETIFAQADAALRQTAIGILAVTLLLLMLAWFGAELIVSRRFRTLMAMTRRVRAGDFSARCGFDEGREEFAQLGMAFDAMAGELQDRDTRLQEALERLRAQAITDELTGLYNRRHLWNALEAELVRARRKRAPLSVLLFDIDHFKQLNDRWGHEAGDLVLQNLAQAVRRVVRGTDIVARHGGEEFVVVMPEAGEEVALLRARQLRTKIAEIRLSYQGQSLGPVTISVGVVVSSDASHPGETLVREADSAMYEAKTRGRDQVVLRRLGGA